MAVPRAHASATKISVSGGPRAANWYYRRPSLPRRQTDIAHLEGISPVKIYDTAGMQRRGLSQVPA